MKEKWFNNKDLMCQLIIVPPIFIYGLYHSSVFKARDKKLIYLVYTVLTLFLLSYFIAC